MKPRYITWHDGTFLGWRLFFVSPQGPAWFLQTLLGLIRELGWPECWLARTN